MTGLHQSRPHFDFENRDGAPQNPNGLQRDIATRPAGEAKFRESFKPSTTAEGQKVPPNLTKLGHRTGQSGD